MVGRVAMAFSLFLYVRQLLRFLPCPVLLKIPIRFLGKVYHTAHVAFYCKFLIQPSSLLRVRTQESTNLTEPGHRSLAHSLLPLLPSLGNRRSSLQLLEPSIAGRVLRLPVLAEFTSASDRTTERTTRNLPSQMTRQ
jgi:hypothetical protein